MKPGETTPLISKMLDIYGNGSLEMSKKDKPVEEMNVDEKLTKVIEQQTTIIEQNEEIIEKLANLSLGGADFTIYD